MGRAKQKMMEDQENEELYPAIAAYIGIDDFDLERLDFEIKNDYDSNSMLIKFSKDSAKELKGLIDFEEKRTLRINYSDLINNNEYDGYDYFDEDEFDSLVRESNSYIKFLNEIDDLKRLLDLKVEKGLYGILYRQIYIGLVGTLETYLSEKIMNEVMNNKILYERFIKTHPHFKEEKFVLRDYFTMEETLRTIVKRVLLDQIYHKLSVVKKMYEATFEITFPVIGELSKIVNKRHDLVHRNGKTKDGQDVFTSKDDVMKCLTDIKTFIDELNLKLDLSSKGVKYSEILDI